MSKIPIDKTPTRGGTRPGAGRPAGSKNWKTVEREQIRAEKVLEEQQKREAIARAMPLGFKRRGRSPSEAVLSADIEEEFKKRVALSTHSLINAQLTAALGEQHLYKRVKVIKEDNKEGYKHVLVTDPTEIREFLDDPLLTSGEDYYYISVKSPDVRAIDSLFDRLLGKASTRIVGGKNPDGSDGPIQVIVANFDAVALPTVQDNLLESVIHEAVEEVDDDWSAPKVIEEEDYVG